MATGIDFPDGLVAAALGLPLLLVPASGLPAETGSAIRALGATSALVLGGSHAVSDATAAALAAVLTG